MNLVWAIAAFMVTSGIVLLVGMTVAAKPRNVSARLKELTSAATPDTPHSQPGRRGDAIPLLTRMLTGRRITEHLYVELSAAGLPIRPSEFVGILGGSIVLSQLLAIAAARGGFGHVLFGVVGAVLPLAVVRSLQRKRRAAFDNQIVDALMTMSASFKSGFSLLRAMQMVAQEMPPPISKEFERVVNEVGVGRPIEDALRATVARVGSYDFDLVVTAILIHLQVGGNLAEILETIADTIRERAKVMGEMRALTAEGRVSGWVLVVLPLVLALVLFEKRPEYMTVLLNDPIGPGLIYSAAILQMVGVMIMRRMLSLDV